MSKFNYDSRKKLLHTEFPKLNRQIGVLAYNEFFHQTEKVDYIDISYETISINTHTFGNRYPVTQAKAKIKEQTKIVIEDLDKVIKELTEHRDRLVGEWCNVNKS